MHIVICLDDKNGMLFNHRRQSQNRLVRQRIAALTAGAVLRMNAYSAGQFADEGIRTVVSETFLEDAGPGDFCFVENVPLKPYESAIEALYVFRWNRTYPHRHD